MFWTSNKKTKFQDTEVAICTLLIHAARADEDYIGNEKKLIKKSLYKLGIDDENYISELIKHCEIKEKDSIEIFNFTKKIKKLEYSDRLKIIEMIIEIIYCDDDLHCLEDRLVRKIAGLIYIKNKDLGNIKKKVKDDLHSQ